MSVVILGTRYHGTLAVDPADEIHCPVRGLPDRWYLLATHPQIPWLVFQAADDPRIALPVCDPWVFWPAYTLPDPVPVAADEPAQRAVLVIVTAGPQPTANLRAPLCIDRRTRVGRQWVLDTPYPFQEPVPLGPSRRTPLHVVADA